MLGVGAQSITGAALLNPVTGAALVVGTKTIGFAARKIREWNSDSYYANDFISVKTPEGVHLRQVFLQAPEETGEEASLQAFEEIFTQFTAQYLTQIRNGGSMKQTARLDSSTSQK